MPNYWADKIEPDLPITLEQAPALAYVLSGMSPAPGCDCCPFSEWDEKDKCDSYYDTYTCSLLNLTGVNGAHWQCDEDHWLKRARKELAALLKGEQ